MSIFKCSLILSIVLLTLVSQANTQVVCSLDELTRELREDLLDNGKLDCLRKSASPNEANETEEQRLRRKQAEWNSDCSFEAEGSSNSHWLPKLVSVYGITDPKPLVDVDGNRVEKDFEDQADMCEIVRALIANGKIPEIGEDVKNINMDFLDDLDCPGSDGQTQLCAATARSHADKKGWVIFLSAMTLTVNKLPKFNANK
jgi:hypothetical protein